LDSLVRQTTDVSLFEVIIINNNSTDNTQAIGIEYEKKYRNFKIVNEKNQGLSYARNRGLKEAKYDWVSYIDDDARAFTNYVERALETIENYNFDCFGGMLFPWYRDSVKPEWMPESFGQSIKYRNEVGLLDNGYISGGVSVFKKEPLLSIGGFPVDLGMNGDIIAYGEETYVQNKLIKRGFKVGFDPELCIYHLVPEYKQKINWHIRSAYAHGRDSVRIFGDFQVIRFHEFIFQVAKILVKGTLKGTKKLVSQKDYFVENLFLDVFQPLARFKGFYDGNKKFKKKESNTQSKRIVCLDNANAYKLYKEGIYPSHFLYGAIEIEREGYEIICISKSVKKNNLVKWIENSRSILKEKPAAVFVPFITDNEFWLSILKILFILRCPILGFSHKTISASRRGRLIKKIIYRQYSKIFFLSPLSMEESIRSGLISEYQSMLVNWGADLAFYEKVQHSDLKGSGYFISTGKESRDFNTLIDAFTQTDKELRILTAPHAGRNYEYLKSFMGKFHNIDIKLIRNDSYSCFNLARETTDSFCVVVPLLKCEMGFCVGLSSVAEAIALGKPIITTDNPYYPIDVVKENIGLKVDSVDSWINAINYLFMHPAEAKIMGMNARKLAETKYNIENSSNEIIKCINSLVNC